MAVLVKIFSTRVLCEKEAKRKFNVETLKSELKRRLLEYEVNELEVKAP